MHVYMHFKSGRCNFLKTIYREHYMSETWTEQNDMDL